MLLTELLCFLSRMCCKTSFHDIQIVHVLDFLLLPELGLASFMLAEEAD